MDIATLFIGMILVGVSAFLIGYPLIKPEESTEPDWADLDDEDSYEKHKESVFKTLGEIEFDYLMKKLSPEDYESLKNQYKSEAVSILKAEEEAQLAELDRESDADAELEKEIEAEIEKELAKIRKQRQQRK